MIPHSAGTSSAKAHCRLPPDPRSVWEAVSEPCPWRGEAQLRSAAPPEVDPRLQPRLRIRSVLPSGTRIIRDGGDMKARNIKKAGRKLARAGAKEGSRLVQAGAAQTAVAARKTATAAGRAARAFGALAAMGAALAAAKVKKSLAERRKAV